MSRWDTVAGRKWQPAGRCETQSNNHEEWSLPATTVVMIISIRAASQVLDVVLIFILGAFGPLVRSVRRSKEPRGERPSNRPRRKTSKQQLDFCSLILTKWRLIVHATVSCRWLPVDCHEQRNVSRIRAEYLKMSSDWRHSTNVKMLTVSSQMDCSKVYFID